MSNLLKGYFVSVEDNKRVVDSNGLLEIKIREEAERQARLQAISDDGYELEDEFKEGLPIANLDQVLDADSESAVIKANNQDELDELNAQLEAMRGEIDSLNEEAQNIISSAQAEADSIRSNAYEEGRSEGYSAGYDEGIKAVDELKNELYAKEQSLIEEYDANLATLEPMFVERITDIYEHIFKVDLKSYRDIVLNLLIETVNSNADIKNIIVHVSKEDFENVIDNKGFILTETGMQEDNVEFIQDATLNETDCIIETDNGVYDCSLGTELKELKRKLALLSYRG